MVMPEACLRRDPPTRCAVSRKAPLEWPATRLENGWAPQGAAFEPSAFRQQGTGDLLRRSPVPTATSRQPPKASVAQWQSRASPAHRHGFDSRRPHHFCLRAVMRKACFQHAAPTLHAFRLAGTNVVSHGRAHELTEEGVKKRRMLRVKRGRRRTTSRGATVS